MYKSIYDIKLTDLLPPNMDSPEIQASCAALDVADQFTVEAVQKVCILANKDPRADNVIDMLALQQHVDYYNQSLPLEARRNLIKSSGFIHRIKGTKAAVEQVARIVFGSARVQEWFEYGGKPYCFRVLIDEFPNSENKMSEAKRSIESSKNARSHLDDVIVIAATAKATAYFAGVIQMSVNFAVIQNIV